MVAIILVAAAVFYMVADTIQFRRAKAREYSRQLHELEESIEALRLKGWSESSIAQYKSIQMLTIDVLFGTKEQARKALSK
jgi:hypothetical protein